MKTLKYSFPMIVYNNFWWQKWAKTHTNTTRYQSWWGWVKNERKIHLFKIPQCMAHFKTLWGDFYHPEIQETRDGRLCQKNHLLVAWSRSTFNIYLQTLLEHQLLWRCCVYSNLARVLVVGRVSANTADDDWHRHSVPPRPIFQPFKGLASSDDHHHHNFFHL